MPTLKTEPEIPAEAVIARAPDGAALSARFDGTRLTVVASDGCWRRAPADAKAIENGVRFLLVDMDGRRRIARVVCAGSGS